MRTTKTNVGQVAARRRVRGELGLFGGRLRSERDRVLDERDSEREGEEEFPRLHACSTIDRQLETRPTTRPQM